MTDSDTKSGHIGSHSGFQDGYQGLNNTSLNHIYYNEGITYMSNYLLMLKVKV